MKTIYMPLILIHCVTAILNAQIPVSDPTADNWEDPAFINEFLGSYGFLAGYEPEISEDERQALRDLIDLINVSRQSAIRQLEPQIDEDTSAAFDFILANLFFQENNLEKADEYYRSAIAKHPDFRRAYKNLGLLQVQSGNFGDAVTTITKAMELGEVDGRSYGLLGYSYLSLKRYYPAEAAYRQAVLMQPEVTDWGVGLARTLIETESYSDAIALFDWLLKDDPGNADYWLLQSNAYLGIGEPLRAGENIEMVRRMGSADFETLALLGDIYINDESPDLALDAYLEAIALADRNDAEVLLRTAGILARSENYGQAKTMIRALREEFGEDLDRSEELRLLGIEARIARAEGDDEESVAILTEIVERDSLNGDALIQLGNYYAEQRNMAKASNRYEQARNIESFRREALIAHAQALVRNRDYEKAVPLLRQALEIEHDESVAEYMERVERAARSG